ncbi:MAG: hypothetical protein ACXAEN_21100 [Candidatus Thorarchaeota archaeon]
MNLEYCRNPKPWYPFAYQQNLPDTRIREHLELWKERNEGELPPRIDVLFSPLDDDLSSWKKGCLHKIPSRPDIVMLDEPRAWRYMNRDVDGFYEKPCHYAVWGLEKKPYYAVIIEDLELYPYDRMETLDLKHCRHYPDTKRIGRASMINMWTKADEPEPAVPGNLSILGRAVLREPFAIQLLPKPNSD